MVCDWHCCADFFSGPSQAVHLEGGTPAGTATVSLDSFSACICRWGSSEFFHCQLVIGACVLCWDKGGKNHAGNSPLSCLNLNRI